MLTFISGIANTLSMLAYKTRNGNVQLVEDYDTSLPPVKAFVGELNQVWTNLLDNALDAMEVNNKGRLEIKTKTGQGVCSGFNNRRWPRHSG